MHGADFYPPGRVVPGAHVRLNRQPPDDGTGFYMVSEDGCSVEWVEVRQRDRKRTRAGH